MSTYYVLLIVALVLSLLPNKLNNVAYWWLFILLFIIAAFRSSTVDQDYWGYIEYYNEVIYSDFKNVEPSFRAIVSGIDTIFGNPNWLFIVYAFGSVGLMAVAIKNIESEGLRVAIFYLSGYFLLWSMTQIRVAIAGAFFLLAIPYLADGKRLKYLLVVTIAVFFHYLSFILYLLLPINSEIRSAWKYLCLIPLGIIIYLFGFNISSLSNFVPIELIALKLLTYDEQREMGHNIFNYLFIARCIFSIFLLYNIRKLETFSKYSGILLKIYFIGLFIHVAFGVSPLASRASELLLIVEILLVAIASKLVTFKLASNFLVFAVAVAYLTFNLFYAKLVNNYAFIS